MTLTEKERPDTTSSREGFTDIVAKKK